MWGGIGGRGEGGRGKGEGATTRVARTILGECIFLGRGECDSPLQRERATTRDCTYRGKGATTRVAPTILGIGQDVGA